MVQLINYLSTSKLKNQLLYTINKKTFEISKIIFTENLNFKYRNLFLLTVSPKIILKLFLVVSVNDMEQTITQMKCNLKQH